VLWSEVGNERQRTEIAKIKGFLGLGIESLEAPQPFVRFWLDLRVVLAELSLPGPLSKGVRKIELGKRRHYGWGVREGLRKLDETD
jgi:hypothetical protein